MIPADIVVATNAPTVNAVVTTIPVAFSEVTVKGPQLTAAAVIVVPIARAVVMVKAETVTAAFVPALKSALAAPGTASGNELIVPVGEATSKNFLYAPAAVVPTKKVSYKSP